MFNRTVTLRDSWAERSRPAASAAQGRTAGFSRQAARQDDGSARHASPVDSMRSPTQKLNFRELVSLGVSEAAAASMVRSPGLLGVFHAARDRYPGGAASIADWLVNDVARLASAADGADLARLEPAAVSRVAEAVDDGELSHRQGRAIVEALLTRGVSFEEARASLDLTEIDDETMLSAMLRQVADEYPDKVAAYRGGQHGLLDFFVGQVMRHSRGKADPRKANELARAMFGKGHVRTGVTPRPGPRRVNALVPADNVLAITGILFIIVWGSLYLEGRFAWARTVSAALMALLGGLVLSNAGILPFASPAYDFVNDHFILVAIPLLLFKADLRVILRQGGQSAGRVHGFRRGGGRGGRHRVRPDRGARIRQVRGHARRRIHRGKPELPGRFPGGRHGAHAGNGRARRRDPRGSLVPVRPGGAAHRRRGPALAAPARPRDRSCRRVGRWCGGAADPSRGAARTRPAGGGGAGAADEQGPGPD